MSKHEIALNIRNGRNEVNTFLASYSIIVLSQKYCHAILSKENAKVKTIIVNPI